MANQFVINFDATGVEPASTGFVLPPEGVYRARIKSVKQVEAKKAERAGEFNHELDIQLNEVGFTSVPPRKMWIPEPVSRTGSAAGVKAANFGKSLYVAMLLSMGIPREKLIGNISLGEETLLNNDVYVKISHEASDKLRQDGTPFVNLTIDGFVTKADYDAEKAAVAKPTAEGVTATAAPATVTQLPARATNGTAGASVAQLLGQR